MLSDWGFAGRHLESGIISLGGFVFPACVCVGIFFLLLHAEPG